MPTGVYKHKPHSEETKRKIGEGYKNHKSGCQCFICQRKRGEFVFSKEHRRKIGEASSRAMLGRNPEYPNGHPDYFRSLSRKIWEEHHGRKIPKWGWIHHLDFNPENIAPENLALLTPSNHKIIHAKNMKAKSIKDLAKKFKIRRYKMEEELKTKFVNYSKDAILIRPLNDMRAIKLLPGKTLPRDKLIGTSEVLAVGGQKRQVFRPLLNWKKESTSIIWKGVPEDNDFAPFRVVSFYDDHIVKTRRRPGWKMPQLRWPWTEFYFASKQFWTHTITPYTDFLDSGSRSPTLFNMIPSRRSVVVTSEYAKFKRWVFDEIVKEEVPDPKLGTVLRQYVITSGHGEDPRTGEELEKIEKLAEGAKAVEKGYWLGK